MSKWMRLSILIFLAAVAALFLLTKIMPNLPATEIETVVIEPEIPRKVYLGAWVGGFWTDTTRTLNSSALTSFEKLIDKKVAIANIYTDWTYLREPALIKTLNIMSSNGWTPMISSNPKFFSSCPDNKKSLYKTVAEGECDDFLREAAKNLRSYNKQVFFRFAWEMNLPQMYWSVQFMKSNPSDFKSAWRRLYTIFQEEKAENVIWVLSFNTSNSKTIPYKELYPGNDYVDWVAIDGYNWGNSQDWSGWTSFNSVFRSSYNELTAITSKPVMLSEVNSAPGPNKPEWLRDMLAVQIPQNFPNVSAVIFFNENKTEGEDVDWRIEIHQENLSALHDVLDNSIYSSVYP